ncbi:uncharacterized protein LOC107723321 [Sinocyclocheilus rhinocerous]|uniref:uncharacterized protein LOC107723321 n=1 Tax=Sinocyclocheilus rhinocerous TaxID=307959 RepID=UPI0007BAD1C9|nr:PREDICTED: uncharacterized protein LOC107723321 [Sinocyclocheilus rhinocerous]
MTCNHCHVREAIIRCGECLPSEWFCAECDQLVHKHHTLHSRQRQSLSEEPGFFDGMFLAKDSNFVNFVEEVRGAIKSTAGKATCGESNWTAARETLKQANKLDEEGVEIAVCRHGFLLKGLNMYRGEIFAYPMFLQKEFQGATFLAMDVTCRYVPYLEKVSEALTHLQPLQKMRHCLSVMHANAHNTKCEILWNARNQEGAGTTLGEEVEQVNSFLSRCALTTKYMAKSVRTDMLTVHAIGWNQRKENVLHIALSSRYKKTVEKTLDVTESLKKMQDQLHCYPNGFTEEGSKGLISLLKRRLQDLRLKQQTVACTYRGILEPTPRLVEEEEGEMEEEMDWQHDISSEDEDEDDDAEVGTQVT